METFPCWPLFFQYFPQLKGKRWPSFKQKICEEKIFQLQSMLNAIICIEKMFAVKNSGVSCLISMFDLELLAI